jgi:ParB-like chromosome segregation protein Spo0J
MEDQVELPTEVQSEVNAPKSRRESTILKLDSIVTSESPRLSGWNQDHVSALAQLDVILPPIIVHRSTMCVVDGVHRIHAARLRGDDSIQAVLFDGSDEDAFILAVKLNTTHGLPLTLRDRTAAARRILMSRPEWSDRRIARTAGLAPSTVAAMRREEGGPGEPDRRIGLDGRARPVDQQRARQLIKRLLLEAPDSSLREIARRAGVSPETVRGVRATLQNSVESALSKNEPIEDQLVPVQRTGRNRPPTQAPRSVQPTVRTLRNDPALRYSEVGRALLRWLDVCLVDDGAWERIYSSIPIHLREMVADAARECAETWEGLANQLEAEAKGRMMSGGDRSNEPNVSGDIAMAQ